MGFYGEGVINTKTKTQSYFSTSNEKLGRYEFVHYLL